MRVLVTGASGLVGGRLAVLLSSRHAVVAARHAAPGPPALASVPMDLLAPGSIDAALDEARPDAVLHCAALADADRCERDPALAAALNTDACASLARACRVRGLRLAALSTDLVFDGFRDRVSEDDSARPTLVYGRTKLAGEEALLAEAPDAAVLRIPLVVGRGFGPRATASEAVAWALRAGRPLRLFTDQFRTPVDPDSIALAVEAVFAGTGRGRFHVGGAERVSRYDLGLRVAAALDLPHAGISAVTQTASPLGPPRPADVSLDSSRAARELGFRPRPLADAIGDGRTEPDIITGA